MEQEDTTLAMHAETTTGCMMDCKVVGMLGEEDGCDNEVVVLNRVIRLRRDEFGLVLECEPNQRHAELIVGRLGLTAANAVATPRLEKTHRDLLMLLKPPPLQRAHVTESRAGPC